MTDETHVTLYADNNSADDAVAIVYGDPATLIEVAVLWCQAGPENKRGFGTNDDDVMLDAMQRLNREIVPECEPPSVTDSVEPLSYVRIGWSRAGSARSYSVLAQHLDAAIKTVMDDDDIVNAYYYKHPSGTATWFKGSAHSHETLLDAINELSR